MTASDRLLTATGIRKSFGGVEVLHGVDLHLAAGEVLALLGENGAGKSTLVKVLAGDYRPDGGHLQVGSATAQRLDPLQARRLGIRMIFQELNDAPTLSVAENIFLGRWPRRAGKIRWAQIRQQASAVLDDLEADIRPNTPMSELRVGQRQLVEIARALSDQARVLILDEPTAALSAGEVSRLFRLIGTLRDRGVGMIYITHRLDEVHQVADRVQVLRDGRVTLDQASSAATRPELVTAMVGRESGQLRRPATNPSQNRETLLALDSAASGTAFRDVTLTVRRGEILALYGKVGAGTAEVAEAVFGLRPLSVGKLAVAGKRRKLSSPAAAIRAGVGFLPADRQHDGAFLIRSVAENLAAPSWPRIARWGWLNRRTEAAAYRRWRDTLAIRSRGDPAQPIVTLSGGNQQKVLLARWMERDSRVLALVEPTRGVDVGARDDIYTTLRQLAANRAVLVATSDHEEVVQLADRALVMARGRVVADLSGDQVTTTALASAAVG